ncbi:MAG: sugar transporter [Bacteroidetes bacterium]|nr:sugar transporter [Bacteroidota bacterium]
MKKISALCFSLAAFFSLNAQIQVKNNQNPVTWSSTYKSVSASEGEIIISANIEKGWHTYSQRETDAGPIPTSFSFPASNNYELIGKTEETDAHEEFVKAFEATIFVFTDKAEFKQKIKLKGKAGFNISFQVGYMTCNDMMCLPPNTVELSIKVQ